jgi:photosystem II stability/assembly factor-like uncharacterized protein
VFECDLLTAIGVFLREDLPGMSRCIPTIPISMRMKPLVLLLAFLSLSIPVDAQSDIEWEKFLMAVPGSTAALFSRTIAVGPDGVIWSGTTGRWVARSTDGGVTWDTFGNGLRNQHYIQTVFAARNGSVYAGGSRELLRSRDTGRSFVVVGPTASNVETILETSDGTLYAAVPDGIGGIYRSVDAGSTWQRLTIGDPPYYTGAEAVVVGSDGALVAGIRRGIVISLDGGTTFSPALDSSVTGVVNQIQLSPNGALFAAADRGIWRSLDGGRTWEHRSPRGDMMLEIRINRLGVIFATSLEQGIYRSRDNGESWQTIHGERFPEETRRIVSIALAPDGRLYGVTSSGYIYRTVGSTTGVGEPEEAPVELDLSTR